MAPDAGSSPQAVLLVHGIGDQKPDWASGSIPAIARRIDRAARALPVSGSPQAPVAHIQAAYWAPILQDRQRILATILQRAPDLELKSVLPWDLWKRFMAWLRQKERRFVAESVGDVIGYRDPTAAALIQHSLMGSLDALAQRYSPRPDGSKIALTIVAHSLGSVIASDFIWDQTRKRQADGQSGFHPFFALRNFFTIDSPLALFSLSYGAPEAFNKPIAMEDPAGRWVNIYDKDDPIAMPLKALNAAYDAAVLADAEVQAGMYLQAHTRYFTHGRTLDIIARKVALDHAAAASSGAAQNIGDWVEAYDRMFMHG